MICQLTYCLDAGVAILAAFAIKAGKWPSTNHAHHMTGPQRWSLLLSVILLSVKAIILFFICVYGIHYRKEQRPITLRVKGKKEHLATEGITGKRQGMRKQMMEGEGIGGRRHRREEQDEKMILPGQGSYELVHS